MAMMRAATYASEGPAAEVLQVRDVEIPSPGFGEVLVRVMASAVNPTDVKTRAGLTSRPIDGFQVPHMDGAGVIEAVGEGVAQERLGERIWLMTAAVDNRWGTAAQFCVVPADRARPLPDGVSFEVGATLGVPAVTAAYCLFSDGSIDGRTVLVAAGAGAVGRSAVELAHWAGARVATTVSGPEKAAVAKAAGADLVINYREAGAADRLLAWSGGPVDRIVELALGPNLDLDLSVSAPGTVVITYAIDGPDPVIPVRRCMMAGITLRFMLLYRVPARALAEAADAVSAALAAGALSLPPVTRFALGDIVAAQEAQEGGPFGRILVDPQV
jgi:NADPH2:quinone reductase